jgi:hypothetical protein
MKNLISLKRLREEELNVMEIRQKLFKAVVLARSQSASNVILTSQFIRTTPYTLPAQRVSMIGKNSLVKDFT